LAFGMRDEELDMRLRDWLSLVFMEPAHLTDGRIETARSPRQPPQIVTGAECRETQERGTAGDAWVDGWQRQEQRVRDALAAAKRDRPSR